MITEHAIQELLPHYPSHAAAAGISPRDWAIDRLSRMPTPPPQAPTQPEEPRPLDMPYSDGHMRAFDQQIQRGVQEQAEDQRDWAELQRIDAELETLTAPLRQRRAALAARIDRRRAH